MTKEDLRVAYKNKRRSLKDETVKSKSIAIANQCLNLPIWDQNVYHIFLSISKMKEVETEPIIDILMGKDKRIAVPKTNPLSNTMAHYELNDRTSFLVNSWGITEPVEGIELKAEDIDVIFVPLLAYDIHGHRVGYGKGYYDRFIFACRPDVITVGLSFFEPESTIIDNESTDMPLDFVITPRQIYDFKRA